jgi:hypothetical protein
MPPKNAPSVISQGSTVNTEGLNIAHAAMPIAISVTRSANTCQNIELGLRGQVSEGV